MANGPTVWDEILRTVPAGSIIAGGAVRDYALDLVPKDIDVWYRQDLGVLEIPGHYRPVITNIIQQEEYNGLAHIISIDDYEFDVIGENTPTRVQYISVALNDPRQVVMNFDHSLCLAMYDGQALHFHKEFSEGVRTRTIRILNERNTQRTLERIDRFTFKTGVEWNVR